MEKVICLLPDGDYFTPKAERGMMFIELDGNHYKEYWLTTAKRVRIWEGTSEDFRWIKLNKEMI